VGIEDKISLFLSQLANIRFIELTGVSLNYLGNGDSLAFICLFLMILGTMLGNANFVKSGSIGILVLSASGIIVGTLKHLFGRARPQLELGDLHFIGPSLMNNFDSMPSGHSMASFTLAAFYSTLYPKIRIPLYSAAAGIAIVGRVFLRHHYLSDVLVGGLLGVLLGVYGAKSFGKWIFHIPKEAPVKRSVVDHIQSLSTAKHLLMIALLSTVILFSGLGKTAYWDRDESEHAKVVLEMENNRDWLTPTLDGKPFLEKPIFLYWTTLISHKIFGTNEFSTRFPSALFGILCCIAVYFLGKTLYDSRAGFYSAIVLATCPLFVGGFHLLLADPPFIFFTLLAFVFYVKAWKNEQSKITYLILTYAAIGMAVLARGPLALFPVPVFIAQEISMRKENLSKALGSSLLKHGGYLLVALMISAPWFIYIFNSQIGSVSFDLLYGDIYRYLNVTEGHRGPLFYYVVVLGLGLFPWTFYIYPALRKDWNRRVFHKMKIEPETFLLLSWFFSVFVITSLCATKLLHFILPALPPIACLIGKFWSDEVSNPDGPYQKFSLQAALLSLTFIMATGSLFFFYPQYASIRLIIPFTLLSGALIAGTILFKKYEWRGFAVICAGSLLLFTSFSALALPWVEKYRVMKPIGLSIKKFAPPASHVFGYFINEPSLRLYSGHPIDTVEDRTVNELLRENQPVFIILEESKLREQNVNSYYRILKRKEGFSENGGRMTLLLITNSSPSDILDKM